MAGLPNIFFVLECEPPFKRRCGNVLELPPDYAAFEFGSFGQTFVVDSSNTEWSIPCRGKFGSNADVRIGDRTDISKLLQLQDERDWRDFRSEYRRLVDLDRQTEIFEVAHRSKASCRFPKPFAFGSVLIGDGDGDRAFPAFMMENLEGCQTLKGYATERFKGNGSFGPEEAADIGLRLLDGLRIMKQGAIVHADLSPRNIMLRTGMGPSGRPAIEQMYIIDFGQSKRLDGTVTVFRGGTPWFSAPETDIQNEKWEYYSHRNRPTVDIWSLGSLLCYIRMGNTGYYDPRRFTTYTDQIKWADFKRANHLELPKDLPNRTQADEALSEVIAACTQPCPPDRAGHDWIEERLRRVAGGGTDTQAKPPAKPEATRMATPKPIQAPSPQRMPPTNTPPLSKPKLMPKPKTTGAFAVMYRMIDERGNAFSDRNADLLVLGGAPEDCRLESCTAKGALYRLAARGDVIDVSDTAWPADEMPPWTGITHARIASRIVPRDMRGWFSGCEHLATLTGIGNIDTSLVTDMSEMFNRCSSLRSLNLSGFNTSAVTNMDLMFYGCSSLETINLRGFDTSSVTSMGFMFGNCSSLKSLNLKGFDTSSVASMLDMFCNCLSLKSLDLSSFDTSSATTMDHMFFRCASLKTLDLSSFDTSSVASMRSMFNGCSSLRSLDLSGFDTRNVQSMEDMFANCPKTLAATMKRSLNPQGARSQKQTQGPSISDAPKPNPPAREPHAFAAMYRMIDERDNALSDRDADLLVLGGAPEDCQLKACETRDAAYRLIPCGNPIDLVHGSLPAEKMPPWTGITYVLVASRIMPHDMSNWFSGCTHLKGFSRFENIDTSLVTNMRCLFRNCRSLEQLDLSGFDTRRVTDMRFMFRGCSSLQALDLSGFDTSSVTSMWSMFNGCSSLRPLDLSNFDTSSVTDMWGMFAACASLRSLDLGGFDTSSVTDMRRMFEACSSLTSLDLSGFDTSRAVTTGNMFQRCPKLASVSVASQSSDKIIEELKGEGIEPRLTGRPTFANRHPAVLEPLP